MNRVENNKHLGFWDDRVSPPMSFLIRSLIGLICSTFGLIMWLFFGYTWGIGFFIFGFGYTAFVTWSYNKYQLRDGSEKICNT